MANNKITTGGKEYWPKAAETLAACFQDDPVLRFMTNAKSEEARVAYLSPYFYSLIKQAVLNDAVITECADWSSCAVWISPGRTIDNYWTMLQAGILGALWNLGVSGCYKMLFDYAARTDKIKAYALKDHKLYYYVFFIGTLPKRQGQGFATSLVKHWQEKAASEGVPIWLEATTAESHRLYERLGFKTIEAFVIGEGKAASDGSYKKGGEGVPLWAMIWIPPKETI